MAKQKHPDTSLILGRNSVREALEQSEGDIEKVMLQKGVGGQPIDAIRRAASIAKVPVQYVPAARLNQMAQGLNHQGVIALAAPIAYQEPEDLLATIAPNLEAVQQTKPLLLLLDGIEDPYNFGAMLRSAVAAGVNGVFVPKHGMAPLNAAAVKASAGTASRIGIARTTNLSQFISALKERGYWIVGAAGGGETSMWEMDWDRPIALVMGSEGSGLGNRVAASCDHLVSIPMRGAAESLNVSVATGILLFTASRPRL